MIAKETYDIWNMESCPLTGLPVIRKREWTDLKISQDLFLSIVFIGDAIVFVSLSGTADLDSIQKANDCIDYAVNELIPEGRSYVRVEDFARLESVSLDGRKYFIEHMKRKTAMKGLIFCSASIILKLSIKLAARITPVRFDVRIAEDHYEAFLYARDILSHCRTEYGNLPQGLKRYSRDDWDFEKDGFTMHFEVIGDDIFYSEVKGVFEDEYMDAYFRIKEKVLRHMGAFAKGYYSICNWSGFERSSWRARKAYVKHFQELFSDSPCQFSVMYGLNEELRFFVLVSVTSLPFEVALAKSFEEALSLIERKRKGEEGEKVSPGDSGKKRKLYTLEELDSYISQLLSLLEQLDWDTEGLNLDMQIHEDHPFLPVYKVIGLIKHDFDAVLREKGIAEKELALSEAKYRNIIENMRDVIFTYGCDGRITYISQSINRFGFTAEEAVGRHLMEFIHPGDQLWIKEALQKTVMEGDETPITLRIVTKSGEVRYIEDSDRIVRDRAGNVVHVVGLLRDVTERIKAEDELKLYRQHLERLVERRTKDLEEANAQLRNEIMERKLAMASLQERTTELSQAKEYAERCNRAKTEFLANISHELRTPLHAIMGFSDCLMAGAEGDEITSYARHITGESTILLSLLNELLDMAKVEAGKLELEVISFDLRKLLEQLITSMSVRAMQKGLALDCVTARELPLCIKGDPNRLRQILNNLLGNAVKFTEHGSIHVEVALQEIVGERAVIHFQVSDTGIGIPAEKQEHIFESFIQADGSTTRKYGGTGLGTTISRQLVSMMGGTIGVKSEVNKGSLFWFTIPFLICDSLDEDSCSEPVEGTGELPVRGHGGRILLVEDYPVNRQIVEAYLSHEGYQVDSVENGRKAVDACLQRAYDIIVMDVQMPEMDGCEATALIRKESGLNCQTPILAMTASAFSDDIQKCMLSGMNEVLTKPVRRSPFLTTVRKWLCCKGDVENSPAPAAPRYKSNEPEPMDFERALAEFSNDRGTLVECVHMFLENCLAQLELINEAAGRGNFDMIRREAHKIKGGAGNLCAFPLEKVAFSLEKGAAAHLEEQVNEALTLLKYELLRFELFVYKACSVAVQI